jgi:hypothetical protein
MMLKVFLKVQSAPQVLGAFTHSYMANGASLSCRLIDAPEQDAQLRQPAD